MKLISNPDVKKLSETPAVRVYPKHSSSLFPFGTRLLVDFSSFYYILATACLSIFLQTSYGATATWDGGTTGNGAAWNQSANWVGDISPAVGDNLVFDNRSGVSGNITSPLTVSSNRTVGLITFDNVNNKLPATLIIDSGGSGTTARTLTVNDGVTLANATTTIQFRGSFGSLAYSLGANNTFTVSSGGTILFDSTVPISGSFGITKQGLGTLTTNASNSYTGATSVNSGTLALGSNGGLSSSSVLNIAAGATFDVKSKTAFTLGAAGMSIDVGASNAGRLDGTGVALTYAGALTLNITSATPLSSYNLFAFGSETGTFDSITLAGSTFSGSMTGSNGIWTATSAGYDFTFTESSGILSTALVPEPSTWALIGLGSAFMLWRVRSRKKTA
jgi:autotransporter-associated beta strand protein